MDQGLSCGGVLSSGLSSTGRPEGWALSEVTASVARLSGIPLPDQTTPEISAITAFWPDWKRKQATLCHLGEDGWICEGLSYSPDLGLVFD